MKARVRVGGRSYEVRADVSWKARLRIGDLYVDAWRSRDGVLVVELRGTVKPEAIPLITPLLAELASLAGRRVTVSLQGLRLIVSRG